MKVLKTLFILVSLTIIFFFILFVINQTSQVVQLASTVSPEFAQITLYSLLIIYTVMIIVPLYLFISLPSSMELPESEKSEEYQKYVNLFIKRFRKNKLVREKGIEVKNTDDVQKALEVLNQKADAEIKKEATTVFTITALSQSGKLDSFIVLILLTRLIYRIAKIYNQRPRLRELIQLYANVFSTSLIAYGIEKIDIGEQIETITDNLSEIAAIGVIANAPGSAVISKMLFDGAINAYLTLRVGIITKQYCSSLVKPERKLLRRSASIQAGKMTLIILKDVGSQVVIKIKNRILEKGESIIENLKDKVDQIVEKGKEKGKTIWDKLLGWL